MTRKQFKELFGEDPVDMFGQDWKNDLDDLKDENKYEDAGDIINERKKVQDELD